MKKYCRDQFKLPLLHSSILFHFQISVTGTCHCIVMEIFQFNEFQFNYHSILCWYTQRFHATNKYHISHLFHKSTFKNRRLQTFARNIANRVEALAEWLIHTVVHVVINVVHTLLPGRYSLTDHYFVIRINVHFYSS